MPVHSDCMCGVCLTSSPRVEDSIEASEAPAPTEPEGRLDHWAAWLAEARKLPPGTPGRRADIRAIVVRIRDLQGVIDWGVTATVYEPDPDGRAGGIGPAPGLPGPMPMTRRQRRQQARRPGPGR